MNSMIYKIYKGKIYLKNLLFRELFCHARRYQTCVNDVYLVIERYYVLEA